MILAWESGAWEEYLEWQHTDKRIVKKINELLKDCVRTPYHGRGKPELLCSNYSGYWSRRITEEHRLIYKVEKNVVTIVHCHSHYEN